MFDLVTLLKTLGYFGITAIIFAETGLLIGFFLPGDSLLFTAGFLASIGYFNVWILLGLSFLAAVIGDTTGYWFGRKYGHKIFKKPDSIFFHHDHIKRSEEFFKKHGGKSVILARFLPLFRTAVPVLAGVGKMDYKLFIFYNIFGGLFWTSLMILLGFYVGKTIPDADHYIFPVMAGIILVSLLPSIISVIKSKNQREKLHQLIKNLFNR